MFGCYLQFFLVIEATETIQKAGLLLISECYRDRFDATAICNFLPLTLLCGNLWRQQSHRCKTSVTVPTHSGQNSGTGITYGGYGGYGGYRGYGSLDHSKLVLPRWQSNIAG